MQEYKDVFHSFVASLQTSKKKFLTVLIILALLLSLPLALLAAQTQQQFQQHASGPDALALPTGTKLLFTIHVDNLTNNYPVVFYITVQDSNNRDHENAQPATYTTDTKGNITLPVIPGERVIITPLASKGYHQVTPDKMDVDVLKGPCGIATPCTFTAHPDSETNTTPTSTTCIPRPACLDKTPHCMIAQPATGWCPPSTSATPTQAITPTLANTPTPSPTPKACPALPATCHYTNGSYCKTNGHSDVCTCGEVICQGL